jgi:precorrin-6B methylase 2
VIVERRDPPYPELKRTHTMARRGRPWTDVVPPSSGPVWAAIEGLARYHLLLAAIELGVFDALESLESASSAALAAEVGASEPHLQALLDGVVALGLLEQRGGCYELNDIARRYLASDGPASMAALVPVAPGPHGSWTGLASTVRTGVPAHPVEDDPEAFYRPLAEGTFTTMWRCATRADLKLRYSARPAPRLLDLGAGGAPWSIAVLTACAGGQAVVNDLPGVLEVAARKAAEHGVADRCELRPGNYHTVPIEPDAYDLVVLGHVCRAEGGDGARHLLARAFEALRPGGRVILADYFCDPDRTTAIHALLMGATMMAATRSGATFSAADAGCWLRSTGFVHLRLVEPIARQQCIVATRPIHKDDAHGAR